MCISVMWIHAYTHYKLTKLWWTFIHGSYLHPKVIKLRESKFNLISVLVDLTSRKSNLSEKLLLGLAKMMPQLILQDIMILLKGKKTHDGKIFHSSTLLEKNSDSIQNMPLNARDSSLTTHYSRYETLTRNNGKFNTLKEGEYLLCSKFLIFMFSLECVQELHNRKRSFSHGICSSKV